MIQPEGFLLINKPAGITSFYCVHRIRSLIDRKYCVGHTGTLDHFATGLLIIALHRNATKHIQKILELDKQYIARAQFGLLTDTLDHTGTILKQESAPEITLSHLQQAVASFGAAYYQTPPIYSALQHEGERLWLLARKNLRSEQELQEIAQKKRRLIQLHALQIQEVALPFFTVNAHISHGGYIRTLMNDIGQKLGTHATTFELQRTQIGNFSLGQAHDLHSLTSRDDIINNLIQVEEILERLNN